MNCKPGWWTVETVQEHWSWVEKCGQWTQVQLGTGKYTGGENLKDSDAVVYIQVFVKDWNRSHANRFRWNNLKQILGVREKQSIECCSGAFNHILTLSVTILSLRWLQWKDQKATVGRLTKVLFNHREYEAISCLQPWKLCISYWSTHPTVLCQDKWYLPPALMHVPSVSYWLCHQPTLESPVILDIFQWTKYTAAEQCPVYHKPLNIT